MAMDKYGIDQEAIDHLMAEGATEEEALEKVGSADEATTKAFKERRDRQRRERQDLRRRYGVPD